MQKEKQDKLFAYLLSGARGCIDEPKIYGALRLLEAFVLLADELAGEAHPFYTQMKDEVNEMKHLCMHDESRFIVELDRLVALLTEYLVEGKR